MVVETVTVPKIRRGSPLLCFVYAKIRKRFRRKLLFINAFNLNGMFLLVIFQYLIFFIGKLIETITVHENAFFNLFF